MVAPRLGELAPPHGHRSFGVIGDKESSAFGRSVASGCGGAVERSGSHPSCFVAPGMEPSHPGLKPLKVTPAVVADYADHAKWLAQQRARLSSPSWLLQLLKQELSRRANAEDDSHFWEQRFTSVVLLDAAAPLACMVYVDLNPLRAGLIKTPETALFTSIRQRAAWGRSGTRSDQTSVGNDLGAQLIAMPQCAPPDEQTEAQERWTISESNYLNLVNKTAHHAASGKRSALSAQALPLIHRLKIKPKS